MPAEYRDRAPRVLRGTDGGDGWSFMGETPSRTFGLEAVAGQASRGEFRASGLTWDEIMPGNYDGRAHLADMDRDGIDGVVVYPTVAMSAYSLPDREFAREDDDFASLHDDPRFLAITGQPEPGGAAA